MVDEATVLAYRWQQLLISVCAAGLAGIGLLGLGCLIRQVTTSLGQQARQNPVAGLPGTSARKHLAQAGQDLHAREVEVAEEPDGNFRCTEEPRLDGE